MAKSIRIIIFSILFALPVTGFAKTYTAIFAGGCFWCIEHDMEDVPGVIKVVSGYTGGSSKNADYQSVSAGGTKHYEAIKVYYDGDKTNFKKLLKVFWRNIDPTDGGGQFCDRGNQYRAAIFYRNTTQKEQAEFMKKEFIRKGKFKTVETKILPAKKFYPAEEYHQDYAKKNPVRYNYYRYRCGRDDRLDEVWGDD